MEQLFTNLSHAVEGAPLIALAAAVVWGVLSIVLSPCHLASIPLTVGFISEQFQVTTEPVRRSLNWNEHSKGVAVVKIICGILVILGGVWLLYTAP